MDVSSTFNRILILNLACGRHESLPRLLYLSMLEEYRRGFKEEMMSGGYITEREVTLLLCTDTDSISTAISSTGDRKRKQESKFVKLSVS